MQEEEALTAEQVETETRYLGLRTVEGLPRHQIPEPAALRWIEAGWARPAADRLGLTPEGWLRLDALVASLSHC